MTSDSPRVDRPRKLSIVHKLLLSLLIALVTAEVALRVDDAMATPRRTANFYAPPRNAHSLYVPHPYMSTVLSPGYERATVPGQVSYGTRINSLGMRGEEMSREKPPGVFRVFCLGGSTTYGTGATESRLAYPAQLEELLNAGAPEGMTYEVGNCGVPGYCTSDTLANLQLRLLDFDPDAILIYHAANDARPIQASGFRSDYSHLRRPWSAPNYSTLEHFLLRNWRTYARLTRGTDPEAQLSTLQSYLFVPGFRALHVPSTEGVPSAGLDAFFRNVRSIVAIARDRDIVPVLQTFATCPKRHKPDDEHFFETVDAINSGLREYAGEAGVAILEIAEPLHDRARLFDDWMHMNNEGSRIHAELVFEELREKGLFGLK